MTSPQPPKRGQKASGSPLVQYRRKNTSGPRDAVITNQPALLPHDEAAERALLGSVLIDEAQIPLFAYMKPVYFYRHQHQLIWDAIQTLHAEDKPVDYITITDALRQVGHLDEAGGVEAVMALGNEVPSSHHAHAYARVVCETYLARFTLRATADLAAAGYRRNLDELTGAWLATSTEINDLMAALGIGPGAAAARFAFLTDEQVEALPDPSWLVYELLVEDTVSVAFGDFGSGKSFLALDWALSIATGMPWMGRTVKQGLVAYIAGEGIGGMKRRIRAWKKHHHWRGGATGLYLLGTPPQLLQPDDVVALQMALRTLPDVPALVVIDTLARSMTGGDENAAQDMGMAVAAAESIRAEFGCHVLIVHHKPNGATKTRGSTALPGAAQTLIDVSKDGDIMTIKCPKQKDYREFDPMRYRLLNVVLDEAHPTNNSLVLVPTDAADLDSLDDAGASVKLTRAAEHVLTLLSEQSSHAAQFSVLVVAMGDRYGMSKSSVANALKLLEIAGRVENISGLWRLLDN